LNFINVAVGTQNGDRGETSQVTLQSTFQVLSIWEPVPSRLLKQASPSVALILSDTGKSFGAARNKFLSVQRIHYCRNATHYHPEIVLNGVIMYSLSNKDKTEYASTLLVLIKCTQVRTPGNRVSKTVETVKTVTA